MPGAALAAERFPSGDEKLKGDTGKSMKIHENPINIEVYSW
jgi:murein L,D-transpeptidase YafK